MPYISHNVSRVLFLSGLAFFCLLMSYSSVMKNDKSELLASLNQRTKYTIDKERPDGFASFEPSDKPRCGEVCSYGGLVMTNGNCCPWPMILKKINCKNIMKRMAYRGHEIVEPPENPPDRLLDEFTMFGEMPITKKQFFIANWTAEPKYFTRPNIDIIIDHMNEGRNVNMYRDGICVQHALRRHQNKVEGKRGFVVGTDLPWLEAILVGLGAEKVTTLEYAELHFETPEIESFTPYEFAEKWLKGEVKQFDFGASFSSTEHSGLGRYSDPLNPYGDLESMAQSWCMVKPGGMFALGVEDSWSDNSSLVWNAHRVYGTKRLAQLTANWMVQEKTLCADVYHHNFMILRKPSGPGDI